MATGFVTHVRLVLLLFVSMTMSVYSTIADMLYRVRPTPMSSHSLPPAHLHRQCQVSDRKRTANGLGLGVYVGFMTHVRLPHDAILQIGYKLRFDSDLSHYTAVQQLAKFCPTHRVAMHTHCFGILLKCCFRFVEFDAELAQPVASPSPAPAAGQHLILVVTLCLSVLSNQRDKM